MGSSSSSSKSYRIVTAAFGLLFALLAIAIIIVSDRTVGPLFAAVVLGSLGIESVASAFRKKPSLLSRIGPLP
jgi:hypothetical protein